MALVIDDGTFTVGNTFLDLIDVDSYHAERLTLPWTEETDNAKKEAAIIRAFDYLRVQQWLSDAFIDGIPTRVEQALCVAANKELDSPNTLQADKTSNVKRKRIEGAIETEYFSKNLDSSTIFTEIDNLIAPYLINPKIGANIKRTLVRM